MLEIFIPKQSFQKRHVYFIEVCPAIIGPKKVDEVE